MLWQLRLSLLENVPEIASIISIWECQWKLDRINDPEIEKFIKNLDLSEAHSPLNPRVAFRGGICGPTSVLMDKILLSERLTELHQQKFPTSNHIIHETDLKAFALDVNR